MCTALTQLLLTLAGEPAEFDTALLAHRSAQNGKGSGIDVAAAYHGGLVCVSPASNNSRSIPTAHAYSWPNTLHWRAYWTGESAQTTAHIDRFNQWLHNTTDRAPLDQLIANAQALQPGMDLHAFQRYIHSLQALDQAAGLGIYSPLHAELHNLAKRHRVLYKPCGAGGGDTGIAVSDSLDDLAAFSQSAQRLAGENPPQPLALEVAEHGIQISR